MSFSHLEFKCVKGVGSIELKLDPDKRVHTFIGENGIGKTKFLESFFQVLISTHQSLKNISGVATNEHTWVLSEAKLNDISFLAPASAIMLNNIPHGKEKLLHDLPIIFMASQNRGFIKHTTQAIPATGNLAERRKKYIQSLFTGMQSDFSSLNMGIDIEQWFIMLAQSSNPYQKKEDNREIEIQTLLKLLSKIDERIDPSFMEIGGDNRVYLKINEQKTELSHLSTGFSSILKILQSIISGYGYFTNEKNILNVKGIVLIDEIESHLHIAWQSKIIPLLKQLFPNTTFYITTHSSIALTQLDENEAYRLQRDDDGVVRSNRIKAPGKAAFIDVLKDAFGLDLNKMKRSRMSASEQKEAKQRLLKLITKRANKDDN